MADKKPSISSRSFARSFSASLAGLRAGGALALDSARQKITGDDRESEFSRREARRFVTELGRLKGSYVKIGQMLALFGEHFLPPVLTLALHELEDKTHPLSWDEMEPIVRAQLGGRYDELDVDPAPLAAASLAQVHRAVIRSSGAQICLKIQYPNLSTVIDNDFDGVVRMLKAARWLKVGRDLDAWLESMRVQLHREIDYARELEITASMAEQLGVTRREGRVSPHCSLHIPKVYPEFSGPKLIAMEYCEGDSVKSQKVLDLDLEDRNALGTAMLRLFFEEVFCWGEMQTDPNFGNYLVSGASSGKRGLTLVLLDFGSVLELTVDQRNNLKKVIFGGLSGDDEQVEDGLKGLNWLSPEANQEAVELFVRFCHYLLEPLRPQQDLPENLLSASGKYCWQRSELIQRVGTRGAKNVGNAHFEMPARDFSLFARKLTGVFTFIAFIGAEFNAHDVIVEYLDQPSKNPT